jgi:hypothetical protein
MDIYEIVKLLGLEKKDHPKITSYKGTFTSGEFANVLFDYGRGLLHVSLTSTVEQYNKETKEFRLLPMVAISTADDGCWQAFPVEAMSQADANQLVEDIYSKWEWKYQLPSEQEMNEFLSQFKMWGENTG